MYNFDQWDGFEGRLWKEEINTRDFIQKNYKPYDGDASFLAGPTEATDNCGVFYRAFRKKSVQRAAFWIWILISYPVLLLMDLDTSAKRKRI